MTGKEQVKILDDKIKANNAQYDLDRINADISAYSNGYLPKYEYLTKKDLLYKPDAFEQAKFEYSPLGKVFIDGLDKSNRKEDVLHIDGIKNFDNIVNNWKQIKDKEIVRINDKNKVDTRDLDIYEIFIEYLNEKIKYKDIDGILNNIKTAVELFRRPNYSDKNKSIINNTNKVINGIELIKSLIDDDNFRIPEKYCAKPLSNIDLSWINDIEGYKETAKEADADYMKEINDNELKLIKDFINKINNGTVNNKNTAANEFRKLKQKVSSDRLRPDLIKDLERYLFGEDI